jgi:hypothetical protein
MRSEEPEEKVEGEPTIQEPEALKHFLFRDTDTGIITEIVEGKETTFETWKYKNRGWWTIYYDPPDAYFTLYYGWATTHTIFGIGYPEFKNRRLPVKPDSTVTSDEVKASALYPETPASILDPLLPSKGSSNLKYIAIAGLGGVVLALLLKR